MMLPPANISSAVLFLLFVISSTVQADQLQLVCGETTNLKSSDTILYADFVMTPHQYCHSSITYPIDYVAHINYSASGLQDEDFINISQSLGASRNVTKYNSPSSFADFWPPQKVDIIVITTLFTNMTISLTVELKPVHMTDAKAPVVSYLEVLGEPIVFPTERMIMNTPYVFTAQTQVALSIEHQTTEDPFGVLCIYDGPSVQATYLGTLSTLDGLVVASGRSLTIYSFSSTDWIIVSDNANLIGLPVAVYVNFTTGSYLMDATYRPVLLCILSYPDIGISIQNITFTSTSSPLNVFGSHPSVNLWQFFMFEYSDSSVVNALPQFVPTQFISLVLYSGRALVQYAANQDFIVNQYSTGYIFSNDYGMPQTVDNSATSSLNIDGSRSLDSQNTTITAIIQLDQFPAANAYINVQCGNYSEHNNYTQPLQTTFMCHSNAMQLTWHAAPVNNPGQVIQYKFGLYVPTTTVALSTITTTTSPPTTTTSPATSPTIPRNFCRGTTESKIVYVVLALFSLLPIHTI